MDSLELARNMDAWMQQQRPINVLIIFAHLIPSPFVVLISRKLVAIETPLLAMTSTYAPSGGLSTIQL